MSSKKHCGLRTIDNLLLVNLVGRFGYVESKPFKSSRESGLEEDLVEMKIR